MLKTEAEGGVHNSWARVCDTCRSAACAVYCRADSAYLCRACDARIHSANPLARRHDRVWVCEACERAPAAFVCKADSASLCTACDAEIHSANPLARRHQRVPILPLSGFVNYGTEPDTEDVFLAGEEQVNEEDEDEAASWLLLNNNGTNNNNNSNMNLQGNGFLFGREVDEYLDLVEYNNNSNCSDQFSTDHHHNQQPQQYMNSSCVSGKNYGGDRVVPIQQQQQQLQHQHHHDQSFQLGLNCDDTSKHGFHFNGFISHSVSIPSADVGVVPESAMSDISVSHTRPPKGTIDLFSGTPVQAPTQLTPMDRVARVQRYRDKKKTRKFEKTIRYASRKAYAETRPRIKGRFAKRTDAKDVEVDQAFSATFMAETGYGIVPSF